MNKTFKRVLASMLAILMIICSMPFTVFAAENNRKWWIDDGVDPSTITSEPYFDGYNSEVLSDEHPEGPSDASFGDIDDLDGIVFYNEDLRDHYKPVFGFTVSDIGTKGNIDDIKAKYRNYYTYDTSCTYEATKDQILDPNATLKVGQRIALTSEFGGVDILNCGQIRVRYDAECLRPGYYNGEITGTRDKWGYVTEATNSLAGATGSQFYNTMTKTNISFPSLINWDGVLSIAFANGLFTNGAAEIMTYIGTAEERPWQGQFGVVAGTAYFEVQKECKITDVFTPESDDGGCILEPIYRMNPVVGEENYIVTIDDTPYTFANAAVVWANPNGSGEEEHQHAFTNYVSNNDATCLADGTKTATCECGEATDTITDEGSKLEHSYTGALTALENNQHAIACVNGCTTTKTVDCNFVVVDHKDATVTEEGYDKYECACGNGYTDTLAKLTCEHVFTNYVSNNDATCTADGTKTATCDVCGDATDTIADAGTMKAHTFTTYVYNNDATCAADGTETATCDECGVATDVRTAAGTKTDAHTFTTYVYNNDATCAADGTETATCDVCGVATDVRTAAGTKTDAHTFTTYAPNNDATCTADGTKTATCDVCGDATDTIADAGSMKAHTFTNYVYNNDATVDADGTETATCDECGVATDTRTAAGTKLAGYNVTVEGTDLGVVTINGVDVTDGATVKVPAQSTVTLVATANDDVKFLGWVANGLTTVSTDATFTTTALADVTYTPVFEKDSDTAFTVIFADGYGNIVSSQVVTDAAQVTIPDAPARSGYAFVGWTMTAEEIAALTASATVIAMYELDESANYTVTATGATITVDGVETADVATDVAYDTLVTVTKEGAKAWSVNGVTVAYGDTYSFYVGKDIEVVAIMDGVEAVPMVGNVGYNEITEGGKIKVQFIATRTMTDDCTYIDSGFVYGKGNLGDITLDDVDGKAVKAAYTKTASEQFSVSYGLSAQSGSMTARAFIAYAKADGEVVVTYAAPMVYTYA